jgi:hypothetical protein
MIIVNVAILIMNVTICKKYYTSKNEKSLKFTDNHIFVISTN